MNGKKKDKKVSTSVDDKNKALVSSTKKVVQGSDEIVKKRKKYNVQVSDRARRSEKDGRMQAAREDTFKKDVKSAGGTSKYLEKTKDAQSNVYPAKRTSERTSEYKTRVKKYLSKKK